MLSFLGSGWFSIGVGVLVLLVVAFGFARLPKETVEWERRRRFFSLIGSLWLGVSFVVEGIEHFLRRYSIVLGLVVILFALLALLFYLRAMFVKREDRRDEGKS